MRSVSILSLSIALALSACSKGPDSTSVADPGPQTAVQEAPQQVVDLAPDPVPALDLDGFDRSADPCVDLNRFTNGQWLDNTPVPAAYTNWSMFSVLEQQNQETVKVILERAAAAREQAPIGSNARKLGDFYAVAMNEEQIERDGIEPLRPDLEQIEGLSNHQELMSMVAERHASGIGVLFALGVEQDLANNEIMQVYAFQGGLGLPDRDYYLEDNADFERIRGAYRSHVARMLALTGVDEAEAQSQASTIFEIETELARAAMSRVQLRDPNNYYNVVDVATAEAATPNIDWSQYFADLGMGELKQFSFSHPEFFVTVDRLLLERPIAEWQAYLRWHTARAAAPYLHQAMVEENFDFYGQTLRGAKELLPRWKRVLEATSSALGDPLSEAYVAERFKPEAKARMAELIENLKAALHDRLMGLEWMSEDTKQQALEKWASFTPKIGYPDVWLDYSALSIETDSYLANAKRARKFEQQRSFAKIGKPIDRSEWGMTAFTVNAYYNPLWNEIVFPAGILQPPFFNPDADDAVNYGAIGAVIGHELLHGFDDSGSRFDAQGRLRMWWTDQDREEFEKRTAGLVRQFNAYSVLDNQPINGELTLGENIADLGGVLVAYDALQRALEKQDSSSTIDGFTANQRFFLSWAQAWRRNYRPEELMVRLRTDTHSPAAFRANGPLTNIEAFQQAFQCAPDAPMVRAEEERVRIW